jgi:hypothetical protein
MSLPRQSLRKIKENWKGFLGTQGLAKNLAYLGLSFALLGCVSKDDVRKDIQAFSFLHDRLPSKLCAENPSLRNFGIYRKLNNGQEEFISYCKTEIEQYLGFWSKDIERMLDKYIPDKK